MPTPATEMTNCKAELATNILTTIGDHQSPQPITRNVPNAEKIALRRVAVKAESGERGGVIKKTRVMLARYRSGK